MSEIPTAKKFLSKNIDYVLEDDCKEDVETAMIEFAKLHVQAALEVAHKIVVQEGLVTNAGIAYFENSYPLNNIK